MIGANPISPPYIYIYIYSFHFITTIDFLILSYLERYKHNWYFSRDRYSLKLSQSGNTCLRIKKYLARNQYHNRILRAHPFKAKGKMCIVF